MFGGGPSSHQTRVLKHPDVHLLCTSGTCFTPVGVLPNHLPKCSLSHGMGRTCTSCSSTHAAVEGIMTVDPQADAADGLCSSPVAASLTLSALVRASIWSPTVGLCTRMPAIPNGSAHLSCKLGATRRAWAHVAIAAFVASPYVGSPRDAGSAFGSTTIRPSSERALRGKAHLA